MPRHDPITLYHTPLDLGRYHFINHLSPSVIFATERDRLAFLSGYELECSDAQDVAHAVSSTKL